MTHADKPVKGEVRARRCCRRSMRSVIDRASSFRQNGLMTVESTARRWERYRAAVRDEVLPAALVDLDAFEANAEKLLALVRSGGKRVRVATKSLRCPDLVERILARAGTAAIGLLTYTAAETDFWAERGARDLVLAYPTVRRSEVALLASANRRGAAAAMVVDDTQHLEALSAAAAEAKAEIPFLVELDVGYRPVGDVHLGVRRSPLRSVAEVAALVELARRIGHLRFRGVMAYEAQVAGVTDENPFTPWMNLPKRWMKLRSRPDIVRRRAEVGAALAPEVLSGGGTGSLTWSVAESALTEVTFGSGFLASHLFDYYQDVAVQPAAYFALEVTRRPAPGIVTCHGGGFVASGESGPDRLPIPALPEGMQLLPLEGAGEVQTPLRLPAGVELALGEPVFFRHAKAGELAEHFNEYLLVRGDRIEARIPTYRGLGRCFLG
jgi:D-serine deaminase-like pyridoxal phosphate-dependent protein